MFYITIQKKIFYFLVILILLINFAYFWHTPRNVFGPDCTLIHCNKFDSLKTVFLKNEKSHKQLTD